VLFLQESPCTNYVCSIGEDEVLFVWKYVESNPKMTSDQALASISKAKPAIERPNLSLGFTSSLLSLR
jgi:hypothetical protein